MKIYINNTVLISLATCIFMQKAIAMDTIQVKQVSTLFTLTKPAVTPTAMPQVEHRQEINLQHRLISAKTQELIVPKDGKLAIFKRTSAFDNPQGSLVWNGSLKDDANAQMTLIKSDKGVTGTIRFDQHSYQIRWSHEGAQYLDKLKPQPTVDAHSPFREKLNSLRKFNLPSEITKALQNDNNLQNESTNTAVIDALFAYSVQAGSENDDIEALIQLAVEETNQGFRNSGINAQLRLVHTEATNYRDSRSIERDLLALNNPAHPSLGKLHQLRDKHAADVVFLVYGSNDACGGTYGLGSTRDSAFAAVNDICFVGNYTTAHELGHLLFARHNPEIDPEIEPYEFGHGFLNTEQGWRTVMAYNNSERCCPKHNHWSNPENTFQGMPRGSKQLHDNARLINMMAPVMAKYRGGETALPPSADFGYQVQDLAVQFNDTSESENDIIAWLWHFGDGQSSAEQSPLHHFTQGGEFHVSLMVTDSSGLSNRIVKTINTSTPAQPEPPTANFTANKSRLQVHFIDQSNDLDGDIVSWHWDFGDGTQSEQQSPQHLYREEGNYQVTLTVEDSQGLKAVHTKQLNVFLPSIYSQVDFNSGFEAWSNVSYDDSAWFVKRGKTPSRNTGPDAGFSGRGQYVYIETSFGGAFRAGNEIVLEGPTVPAENLQLSFAYHMFGNDIGSLAVDVLENGQWQQNVWTISSQQQSSSAAPFLHQTVDLSGFSGEIKVRFRATMAGGAQGDIALDQLKLERLD